jgi:hypothetical protein
MSAMGETSSVGSIVRRVLGVVAVAMIAAFAAAPAVAQPAPLAGSGSAGSGGAGSGSAGSGSAMGSAAATAPAPATPPAMPPATTPLGAADLRKTCTDAMNADPTFADAVVTAANKAAAEERIRQAMAEHADAAYHIAKNERHVILAYAAMWVVAAAFVIFLWRRQRGLREELARLRHDLDAATAADQGDQGGKGGKGGKA